MPYGQWRSLPVPGNQVADSWIAPGTQSLAAKLWGPSASEGVMLCSLTNRTPTMHRGTIGVQLLWRPFGAAA